MNDPIRMILQVERFGITEATCSTLFWSDKDDVMAEKLFQINFKGWQIVEIAE